MALNFRRYTKQAGITEDYYKVRDFLVKLGSMEYTYVRWDWMITHTYLDKSYLGNIGIWEEEGEIIGTALYDCQPGQAFCLALPQYAALKKEMLLYAKENLSKDGSFTVAISDSDRDFQNIAAELGFIATENKECNAAFYTELTSTAYVLPEGYRITDMKETYDIYQYCRVLWKGFNHELNGEGEFHLSKEKELARKDEMLRPNVDLDLKIAVVSPEGNFVSYSGIWYDPAGGFAVIEPVATDPDYRRMGLGKAAVLEGIRRVGERGAKLVLVGSSQQFYYSIGMRPVGTATLWECK